MFQGFLIVLLCASFVDDVCACPSYCFGWLIGCISVPAHSVFCFIFNISCCVYCLNAPLNYFRGETFFFGELRFTALFCSIGSQQFMLRMKQLFITTMQYLDVQFSKCRLQSYYQDEVITSFLPVPVLETLNICSKVS